MLPHAMVNAPEIIASLYFLVHLVDEAPQPLFLLAVVRDLIDFALEPGVGE